MFRVIALMFAGLLASGTALAADNGVYLGFGIAQSSVDVDFGSVTVDDDDTSFKVIAGVRPLDWLAFEVNYVDFGTFEPVPGVLEFDAKGIDAFAVGLFEVGVVDFFGKVGIIRWDADVTELGLNDSESGNDLAYGVGVGAHFGSIGVRAEYERFEAEVSGIDSELDFISLSLTWTFL